MGSWSLEKLSSNNTPLNGQTFGTNFNVHYLLKYSPSIGSKFQETPMLDWHEKITMIEHHKGEWWEFETNMYEHNPTSKTLEVWPRRYYLAYNDVFGVPHMGKGSCKLFDKNGVALKRTALPAGKTSDKDKANAVRSYLKSHGGKLAIHVHDIPSINMPKPNQHKERLLLFKCGVIGSPLKIEAEQYLNVQAGQQPTAWGRELNMPCRRRSLTTTGFNKVNAPTMVSNKRAALFLDGEYK